MNLDSDKLITLLKEHPKSNIEIINRKDKIEFIHFIHGKGNNKKILIPNNKEGKEEMNQFLKLYMNMIKPNQHKIDRHEFHCFKQENNESKTHLYYDCSLTGSQENNYVNYLLLLTKYSENDLISIIVQKLFLREEQLLIQSTKKMYFDFQNYMEDIKDKTKLELINLLLELTTVDHFEEEISIYTKKYS